MHSLIFLWPRSFMSMGCISPIRSSIPQLESPLVLSLAFCTQLVLSSAYEMERGTMSEERSCIRKDLAPLYPVWCEQELTWQPMRAHYLQITAARLEPFLCGRHCAEPCRCMISRSAKNSLGWMSSQLNGQMREPRLSEGKSLGGGFGTNTRTQVWLTPKPKFVISISRWPRAISLFFKRSYREQKELVYYIFYIPLPSLCPSNHLAVFLSFGLPKI